MGRFATLITSAAFLIAGAAFSVEVGMSGAVKKAGKELIEKSWKPLDAGPEPSLISTVAGTGTAGYNYDGIVAIAAELNFPAGIFVDRGGNIYIADSLNHRVRKVDAGTGLISTVAGTGTGGYNGDDIAATSAWLNSPAGVSVDAGGNIYIADSLNNRIRKVEAGTGLINTVAGTGAGSYNSDGIAATLAYLNFPHGVAVDGSGTIYIADTLNHRIRKVAAGIINTVAGTDTNGYNGDGIAATSAFLNYPSSVQVDATGNIYIADWMNQRIRKVVAGTINTVAGTGTEGYNGDGIAATSAQLYNPKGVSVDGSGNIYVADTINCRIRKVAGGIISTVAGTGTDGYNGDGIAPTSAYLYFPHGVCADGSGGIYIADYQSHRIRRVSP